VAAFQNIPGLPAGIALNGTEQFWAVQQGTDVRLTATQLGTYIQANFPLSLGQITLGSTSIVGGTPNQLLYDAAGKVGEVAAGAPGQILQLSGGGIPTWVSLAGIGVTGLSFGTTGLTPNSLTDGNITVAGTLVPANGGTGIASYAVGDILYASGATALARLADVATGNALISGGVGVAPSWGEISLTTTVSGILPPANGGTGVANTGTFTVGGNTAFSGAFTFTGTLTGNTAVTFPTSGTLSTTTGTVTAVSVATANGFAGSSSGGATPALTLSTTVNAPVLAGNGAAIAAATTSGSGSTVLLGISPSVTTPALTGSSSGLTTLASANAGASNFTITFPAATGTVALTSGANVASVSNSDGTLTISPTSGAVVASIALGHANTWSGQQTFVAPVLGAATATSINGNTFTAGTYTLTGAAGKTLTFNNTITLAGTDAQTYTFPTTTATIARTDAAQTFTGVQTFSTPIASTSVATMTATVGGGVPTPPNNTTTFLRGDGTFATPSGGGNVSNTGTPTNGQLALWTNATTIQGLTALPAANFPALTGPITTTAGSLATTIASSVALPGSPTTTTQTALTNNTTISTTAYTDAAVAAAISGVNPAVAVSAATTAAGNTSTWTYNNGVSGVGATFTGPVNTAITIDGFTFTTITTQSLLVKNDTQSPSGAFNGVYVLTAVQTVGTGAIFTRRLDYDTPSDINDTGAIPVVNGTSNATTSWLLTSNVTTVGTSPLTYVQFSLAPSTILTATAPTNHGVLLGSGAQAVNATSAGTAGQVLTSNGASADPTFQAAGSSVTTVTANNTSTSLAITGLSGDIYQIDIENLTPATDGDTPQIQLGTGAGPTYITAGGDYQYSGNYVSAAAANNPFAPSGVNNFDPTNGVGINQSADSAVGMNGWIRLINMQCNGTKYTTVIWQITWQGNASVPPYTSTGGGQIQSNTTAKTAFRFLNGGGHNWKTGQIKVTQVA
jgi:hypothetical protein